MGDSSTEGWGMKATATSPARGEFFPGKPYVYRGISGQTSPQMLVRFREDIVDLKPLSSSSWRAPTFPGLANSKRPTFCVIAPVKAPRS
jgi:hypothetical protein